eukprot:scaffold68204_cov23-Cyclotella_meneghiniana.AAC.6
MRTTRYLDVNQLNGFFCPIVLRNDHDILREFAQALEASYTVDELVGEQIPKALCRFEVSTSDLQEARPQG